VTEPARRPYERSRRDALFDLYERVWGTRPEAEDDEWWHERNPVGPALRTLAERDGRVVGVASMSFLRARVDGAEELVPVAVGLATDAAERGRGVFGGLERANEADVAARGCSVALVFPNPASRPVLGALGWEELWRGRVWARPPLPTVRRGRFRLEELTSIPDGVERLTDASVNGPLVDAEFLDWRYLRSPRPYRVLGAFEGGDLRGLVAVRLRRGRLAVVCHALGEVGQLLRALGANGALATIALVPHRRHAAFVGSGFVPTPKTVDVLGKSLTDRPLAGSWEFQLGDFDVF
jgi:GNAT superfamily N-acetyltransferase